MNAAIFTDVVQLFFLPARECHFSCSHEKSLPSLYCSRAHVTRTECVCVTVCTSKSRAFHMVVKRRGGDVVGGDIKNIFMSRRVPQVEAKSVWFSSLCRIFSFPRSARFRHCRKINIVSLSTMPLPILQISFFLFHCLFCLFHI